MKRFHVHVAVNARADSARFYSAVFGAEPSVLKDDSNGRWRIHASTLRFPSAAHSQELITWGFRSKTPASFVTCAVGSKRLIAVWLNKSISRAATPSPINIGSAILKGSPGKRFVRSTTFRCSARTPRCRRPRVLAVSFAADGKSVAVGRLGGV
jgi:hypothetical protein